MWQKINFDYLNYKGILGYKKLTAKLLQVNDIWKIFLNQCHLFDKQNKREKLTPLCDVYMKNLRQLCYTLIMTRSNLL